MSEIISGASPESSSSSIETAFARGDFRDVKATLRAMSISEGTETRLHFLRDATSFDPMLLVVGGVMGAIWLSVWISVQS